MPRIEFLKRWWWWTTHSTCKCKLYTRSRAFEIHAIHFTRERRLRRTCFLQAHKYENYDREYTRHLASCSAQSFATRFYSISTKRLPQHFIISMGIGCRVHSGCKNSSRQSACIDAFTTAVACPRWPREPSRSVWCTRSKIMLHFRSRAHHAIRLTGHSQINTHLIVHHTHLLYKAYFACFVC